MINNAGIASSCSLGDTTEQELDMVINTNLKGTYFMCQEVANYFIHNSIKGNILNISSVSGKRPAITPYMLSKNGIISLTQGIAKKFIKYGIVVNGLAPGPIATGMLNVEGKNLNYDNSPSKRFADAKEIANWAVILVSDLGKMIVGETIFITGGCGNLTYDDIQY